MSITTKTGDKGKTGLFGGQRVSKGCNTIEAIGDLDELNSMIGVVRSMIETNGRSSLREIDKMLEYIQNSCFIIGAEIASTGVETRRGVSVPKIWLKNTNELEGWIDEFEKKLPELRNFILPGGDMSASQLFLARAICRRVERSIVRLNQEEHSEVLRFTNRLSDLLFLLARSVNQAENKKETIWSRKE